MSGRVMLGLSTACMGALYAARLLSTAGVAWIANLEHTLLVKEGPVEWLEAVLWLTATGLFALGFRRAWAAGAGFLKVAGLAGLVAISFVAFGEEISWGQNLLGFESPEAMRELNAQQETNVHNLNLAAILGLEESHALYPYLKNVTSLLNPIFYAVCAAIWIGPVLLRRMSGGLGELGDAVPAPRASTAIFFAANIVLYILIGWVLWIDVGECFELSVSFTALLAALDVGHELASVKEAR